MRADRSQQLAVSSRELAVQQPREIVPQEARFLKEIEEVTSGLPMRRQEQDWTDSWMGRGDAVYGGVKLCSRVLLGIAFYAALAHCMGIDTVAVTENLVSLCRW